MFGLIALALIFGGAAIASGSSESKKETGESSDDDSDYNNIDLLNRNIYIPFERKKEAGIFKFTSSGYDPVRQIWWKREDKWDIT